MKAKSSAEDIYSLYKKCRSVCTDTRQIRPGSLFFALKGENFDANTFAKEALEKGCSYAVVDNPKYADDEKIFLVEDCLQCLQKVAVLYRKDMIIPVIGVTGTNGKTTTKELLRSVLGQRYRVYATEGNLNNHIGVPLSLLSMPSDTEIAIIEMGASHPGEIAQLCRIALPTFGIITNIGEAHLEGFGNFATIAETKLALYRFLERIHGKAFVNASDPLLMSHSTELERFCYGTPDNVFLQMTPMEGDKIHLFCCLHGPSSAPNLTEIRTKLTGGYNLDNVAAAACAGRYFGLNDREIQDGIMEYQPANLRSQCIQCGSNLIIADAYNANPSSMKAAIENFSSLPSQGTKLAILGEMLELGKASKDEHQKITDLLQHQRIPEVFLVGGGFAKTPKQTGYKLFAQVDELIEYLKQNPIGHHCILIKGSHGVHLEKVVDFFKSNPV